MKPTSHAVYSKAKVLKRSALSQIFIPSHLPEDVTERRPILLLFTMLGIYLGVGAFAAALYASIQAPYVPYLLGILAYIVGLYGMARAGFYRPVALMLVGAQIMLPLIVQIVFDEPMSSTFVLGNTTLTILLAYLLLEPAWALWTVLINLVMVTLLMIDNGFIEMQSLFTLLLYVVGVAITTMALALSRDRSINELQAQVAELQTSEALLRQMTDFSPAALFLEEDSRLLYINRVGLDLMGVAALDALDTASFLQHVNEQGREAITSRLQTRADGQGFHIHFTGTFSRADGTTMDAEIIATPYQMQGRSITLYTVKPLKKSVALSDLPAITPGLLPDVDAFARLAGLMDGYIYVMNVQSDGQTTFDWIEGRIAELTGLSHDVIGRLPNLRTVVYQNDSLILRDHLRKLLRGHRSSAEFRIENRDGTIHWIHEVATPVLDMDGETVTHIYGWAYDITDRMQAEDALKAHVVQQAVIAELGLLALSDQPLEMLLHHTAVLAEQVMQVGMCDVLLYDPDGYRFQLAAQVGLPAADVVKPFSANPSLTQAGYALQSREVVTVASVPHETRFGPMPYLPAKSVASSASSVIQGSDHPYGVLSVHSPSPRPFTDDELYFLQSASNIIGIFIERQKARDAERSSREYSEALREATAVLVSERALPDLLNRILDFLAQTVPAQTSAVVFLLEEDRQTLRCATARSYPGDIDALMTHDNLIEGFPIAQQIMQTHAPLVIDDTRNAPDWRLPDGGDWVRSYLGVPICLNDDCLGILNLYSDRRGAFTDQDAERVTAFAHKAGIAIQNARRARDLEAAVSARTAELRSEREWIETILSATGEGVLYIEDGAIRYANPALLNMTGYTLETLRESGPKALFPQDEETSHQPYTQMIKRAARAEIWRDEVTMRRNDGSTFDAGLTVQQAEDDPSTLRLVVLVRDISHEKALDEIRTRFIANATHELRSPIASLNTRIYLIRHQPDMLDRHVDLLERVIKRMNHLVGNLLDLLYLEQGRIPLRLETVIVQEITGDVVEILADEAQLQGLTLHHDVLPQPLTILADRQRLTQVVINLVNNAINHTEAGGTIWVKIEDHDDEVDILVQDTGEGIPPDELDYIFLPFYRARNPNRSTKAVRGTGLGLSIVKEIVEQHQGRISVQSTPGVGSTFTVRLPVLNTRPE